MGGISKTVVMIWVITLLAWGWTYLSTRFRPHRFRNCFYLMGTILIQFFSFSFLFGDYTGTVMIYTILAAALLLLLIPVMLIYNGIVMIKKESFALGHILSLILGVLLAIGELCYVASIILTAQDVYQISKVMSAIVYYVGVIAFFFGCVMLSFVLYMVFLQVIPHRKQYRYVIIHGCGLNGEEPSKILKERIDKAIDIYRKCAVKPIMIPSGGKGEDEVISEAEAMARYMVEKGVAPEHILKEEVSTTTMENLIESKKLIEWHCGTWKDYPRHRKEIALVSSNYHIYRCLTYAKSIGMKCTGFGSKVAWYYWPSAVIREFVAVITKKKNLIFCIVFFVLYMIQSTVMLWNMW